MLGLDFGYVGVILGLHRDFLVVILGLYGYNGKRMETAI